MLRGNEEWGLRFRMAYFDISLWLPFFVRCQLGCVGKSFEKMLDTQCGEL